MRTKTLLPAVLLIAGCATFEPTVPEGYAGPTATISDHGFSEGGTKGQLFYIEAIDDKPIRSSLHATRQATAGRGFSLVTQYVVHKVPVRPLKLKLVGTHITGAPIHEMFSRAAGTFFRVEGELVFTPVANGEYFVQGLLQETGSTLCIAEVKTEQCVTDRVGKQDK